MLFGDASPLMQQWMLQPDATVALRLHDAVRTNLRYTLRDTTPEALWGSPGTLLAAVFMARANDGAEWAALLREGVLWAAVSGSDAFPTLDTV